MEAAHGTVSPSTVTRTNSNHKLQQISAKPLRRTPFFSQVSMLLSIFSIPGFVVRVGQAALQRGRVNQMIIVQTRFSWTWTHGNATKLKCTVQNHAQTVRTHISTTSHLPVMITRHLSQQNSTLSRNSALTREYLRVSRKSSVSGNKQRRGTRHSVPRSATLCLVICPLPHYLCVIKIFLADCYVFATWQLPANLREKSFWMKSVAAFPKYKGWLVGGRWRLLVHSTPVHLLDPSLMFWLGLQVKVSIKFHGAQYSEKAPKLENLKQFL